LGWIRSDAEVWSEFWSEVQLKFSRDCVRDSGLGLDELCDPEYLGDPGVCQGHVTRACVRTWNWSEFARGCMMGLGTRVVRACDWTQNWPEFVKGFGV